MIIERGLKSYLRIKQDRVGEGVLVFRSPRINKKLIKGKGQYYDRILFLHLGGRFNS